MLGCRQSRRVRQLLFHIVRAAVRLSGRRVTAPTGPNTNTLYACLGGCALGIGVPLFFLVLPILGISFYCSRRFFMPKRRVRGMRRVRNVQKISNICCGLKGAFKEQIYENLTWTCCTKEYISRPQRSTSLMFCRI